jgi:paraquat-inducible protein B
MPKRISSTAIGMFVIGSLALLLATLVVLGSGRLFAKQHKFVCFFSGDLNGLKVGAAVKVRGVQVGAVTQILLRLPPTAGTFRVQEKALGQLPVIFEIDESQLKGKGGRGEALDPAELDALIKRGLRAQLATESFLTGLLYIDLDLHPGNPVHLMLEPGSGPYREIPTIPTSLEQVQKQAMLALAKLEKVDFVALVQSMTDTARSINELVSSPNLKATISSLKDASSNLNTTLISFRHDLDELNHKADPVLASLTKTSDRADVALAQMTAALTEVQMTFAPDAPLTYRLNIALEDVAEASNEIRQLADYILRNPSALVRGKYVSEVSR